MNSPKPQHASLGTGDRIAAYTLINRLGSGGMGEVWRASADDGQEVAIKLLHRSLTFRDVLVKRFMREVALGKRVVHPGVVRTLDGGVVQLGTEIQPWLSMELVQGQMLSERVKGGPLSEADVRVIGRELALALGACHAQGIVHRDVKPENVICDSSGRIRLIDLGIAGARDEATRLTRTGQFAGSVVYAAPEQFHGRAPLDERTDFYALGITLYELATGQAPWRGQDILRVYAQKMQGRLDDPSSLNPRLSSEFDQLIRRMTAPDPKMRPSDSEQAAEWMSHAQAIPTQQFTHAHTFVDADVVTQVVAWDFIGREDLLEQVDEGFDNDARTVVLVGAAGAGKTRLANEFSVQFGPRFSGGRYVVDLSALANADAVCVHVAAALSLNLDRGDVATQLGHAFRGRGRSLLVLDNAEHLVEPVSLLCEKWVAVAPELSLLVTSRIRLPIPGHTVEVGPLSLPRSDALNHVAASEAVRLFVQRARKVAPDFSLIAENAASLTLLVRALDGLPLALELAAARMGVLSVQQILDRMGQRFRLLRGGTGRQSTLRGAIDWSWEQCDPAEQQVLAQCAVFSGGFSIDAAEAVVDLSAIDDAPWVVDLVENLVSQSLLRRLGGDPVRFGMYVSIHEFLAEKLKGLGREAVEARHGTYVAQLAQAAGTRWFVDGDVSALRQLAIERSNLAAAALQTTGTTGATSAWALGLLAERLGPVSQGADALALVAARQDTLPSERIPVLMTLARLQGLASRIVDAQKTWVEAESLCAQVNDVSSQGRARAQRATLLMRAGSLEEAEQVAQSGKALCDQVDDARGRMSANMSLGLLKLHAGELDAGRDYFLQAMVDVDAATTPRASALYNNLGLLEARAENFKQAEGWLQEALAIDRKAGDRLGEGKVLSNLGLVAAQSGDHPLAQDRWEAALLAHRSSGNAESEAAVLGNMGEMAMRESRLDDAVELARASVALKRRLGQPSAECVGRLNLGRIQAKRGNLDAAHIQFDQAQALAEAANNARLMSKVDQARAELD